MKKMYRDQWLSDLRSGEYQQGKMKLVRLGSPDGSVDYIPDYKKPPTFHCCMGVFCESARKVGYKFNEIETFRDIVLYDKEDAFPPADLTDEAGINPVCDDLFATKGDRWKVDFPDGFGPGRRMKDWVDGTDGYTWIPDSETNVGFASMNDTWKLTFSQIADMIEYFIPEDPTDESDTEEDSLS